MVTWLPVAVVLFGACNCHPVDGHEPLRFTASVPQSVGDRLDVIFVTDSSGGLNYDWARCPYMWEEIDDVFGESLNLHMGSIGTDLGAGEYNVETCDLEGGDGGRLGYYKGMDYTNVCNLLPNERFLVATSPVGCHVDRTDEFQCDSHTCTEESCQAAVEGSEQLVLETNWRGCPRCVNHDPGFPFSQTTMCLAGPKIACSIIQPLESLRLALDNNPYNTGFLREDAHLLIVFFVRKDDCSARDPMLFDPAQDSMDAPLGFFSEYRCFEFGVTCDIDDRTHVGVRHDCRPREDPAALLHPVSRYVEFVKALRDPQTVTVAALAAPMDGWNVTVGRDEEDRPTVESVECGRPGIRLRTFVEAFHPDGLPDWAYRPFCSQCDMTFVSDVGWAVRERILLRRCLPQPLAGCPDPGVEQGAPQAAVACDINSRCLARCEVTDVRRRGTAEETRVELPACLGVLSDGTVDPKNFFRELAYEGGYPAERDPELPVEACWSIVYDPICEASRGAALRVSRRVDPPPRTFAELTCDAIPATETNCYDGRDEDEDCLMDLNDPDCGA
ncbi:MAG: hypothetical protein RBU30_08645 [Polyangia bacterium]|jgi:hypothetical protein|nr:hypothetical protein [Polyangia bacterium]